MEDNCEQGSPTSDTAERDKNSLSGWKIVLFGQLVAFLYASGIASQATLASKCNLSAPTVMPGLAYFCLAFNLIHLYWKRRGHQANSDGDEDENEDDEDEDGETIYSVATMDSSSSLPVYKHRFLGMISLEGAPWAYFLMGLLDLESMYFVTLAFRYTTMTSVAIFGSLATPAAIVFSIAFLGRRYTRLHAVGVAVCMLGVLFNLLQDYKASEEDSDGYQHKLRGDLFAILGTVLFGLNDVACEIAVRQLGGPQEYLGMVGFFATIVSTVQAPLLEMDEIKKFFEGTESCSIATSASLTFCFVAVNVMSYHALAGFLEISESALLNLSLLTVNIWSVLFSVAVMEFLPGPLFFAALVFIFGGVCIYERAPSPVVEDRHDSPQNNKARTEMEKPSPIYEKIEVEKMEDLDPTESDSSTESSLDGVEMEIFS